MDRESRPPLPLEERYAGIRQELGRAVAAVCPRWLANQREDIVQAAVVRVLRLEERARGARELSSTYLWRTAYSALIDEIRRVRWRREEALEEATQASLHGASPNPEVAAEGREIGVAIGECLGRLVRPRRLAVTLYLQGHTVPESARLLDYGRKKTENLVYRGLDDLRRCLASKGIEP